MTNGLNFEIERSGFPVKVGTVELWFDDSAEHLRRFFSAEEILNAKMKEIEEKAMHVHFPSDLDLENLEAGDVDVKMIDAALDLKKESIALEYDIILGNGSFKKIYEKYPDMRQLEELLPIVGIGIEREIEKREKNRSKMAEAKKAKYLNKKAKKK